LIEKDFNLSVGDLVLGKLQPYHQHSTPLSKH